MYKERFGNKLKNPFFKRIFQSSRKNSQAALEFLATYGWAFLIMLIVIAALAYFGVLSPSKLLPNRCNFGSEFACLDYVASATQNTIKIRLKNSLGTPITVQSIILSNEGSTQFSCTSTPFDYTSQLWDSAHWSQSGMNWFAGSPSTINDGVLGGQTSFHTDSAGPGAWVELDTGAGNEKVFTRTRYWASAPGYSGVWNIQHSDDNSNWFTVYSGWNSGASADSTIDFEDNGLHRYWRLYKTNPAFGGPWQGEIQFYEGSNSSLRSWKSGDSHYILWSGCSLGALGFVAGDKGKILVKVKYYDIKSGPDYAKEVSGEIYSSVV